MSKEVIELPDDLGDEFQKDLTTLTLSDLEKIPHEIYKWQCNIEGCKCFTRVWDFGMYPRFFWKPDRWIRVHFQFYLCGKHNRLYKNTPIEQMPLKQKWGMDYIDKIIF